MKLNLNSLIMIFGLFLFSGCAGCLGCGVDNPVEQEVIRQVGNITAIFPSSIDTLNKVKPTAKPNEVRITSNKPDTVQRPDVLLIFDGKDSTLAEEVRNAKPTAVVTTPEKKQTGQVTIETPEQKPKPEKGFFDGIEMTDVLIGGFILLVIGAVVGILKVFGIIK